MAEKTTWEATLDKHAASLDAEWGIKCESGSEISWSAEARWTAVPNAYGADHSHVVYVVGHSSPEAAIDEAICALLDWVQGTESQ